MLFFFFFNDTATTEIYTLSLHDALPIYKMPLNETHLGLIALMFPRSPMIHVMRHPLDIVLSTFSNHLTHGFYCSYARSEEHTSELQSLAYLVCRLLLEKKKINQFLATAV